MSESAVAGLLSVAQAMEILDRTPVAPRVVRMALAEVAGLRLAQDLVADRDYPPFKKSLMDGYAVRILDVGAGTAVELSVVGEIPAGASVERTLGLGEAMAIMTGAPLPPGADGVVPVEDVVKLEEGSKVRIAGPVPASRFIAARGSDCRQGTTVLRTGAQLGPAQIAVAASIGAASVKVFAAPRVAVLGTGDELVEVGVDPGESQIRNSNTPMLVALLRRLGCQVRELGTVRDDLELIRSALRRGLEADALFVSGGMSMGTHDHVPRLLSELGVDLRITRLRIKPGKPFVFGVFESSGFGVRGSGKSLEFGVQSLGREVASVPNQDPSLLSPEPRTLNPPLNPCYVFGLPGNPVSAFVCVVRLASRLLARLSGGAVDERWLTGRLEVGLPANGPREFYQPAIRDAPPGGKSAQAGFARITPLQWKGSADLFTLAQANALIVRAENEPPMPRTTVVRVLEI